MMANGEYVTAHTLARIRRNAKLEVLNIVEDLIREDFNITLDVVMMIKKQIDEEAGNDYIH